MFSAGATEGTFPFFSRNPTHPPLRHLSTLAAGEAIRGNLRRAGLGASSDPLKKLYGRVQEKLSEGLIGWRVCIDRPLAERNHGDARLSERDSG